MTRSAERPARLLIVDDVEANRDLLARRARRLGHDTGFAENGRAALEQLRAAPWDLVLLDISMPEMDGYETLTRMRADPRTAETPVVMVSAIDEVDSVVRCLELGADDYLTKPFNPLVLQARIEASLAKKRLADQKQATLQALARELEIGRRIQQGFLPERLPQLAGWQLAAACSPARQVGGDFYDALTLPGGRLAFAVADVCDKGVGAALYMALFRSLLRSMLTQAPAAEEPPAMLERCASFINDYIATEHGRDNMFATVFLGIVDPATGRLDYLNGGHDAPMLARAGGGVERLEAGGPALGLFAGMCHGTAGTVIAAGDRLLVYTDGLTEAIGDAGPLGEDAVQDLLCSVPAAPGAVLAALQERVASHAGAHQQHDDITLLCVARG